MLNSKWPYPLPYRIVGNLAAKIDAGKPYEVSLFLPGLRAFDSHYSFGDDGVLRVSPAVNNALIKYWELNPKKKSSVFENIKGYKVRKTSKFLEYLKTLIP